MGIIRCKMCGGALTTVPGVSVAKCEHCGSLQTVPRTDSKNMLNLFVRGCRLRLEYEFDKAARIYTSLTEELPEEAEVYWGLLLCKNGIVYSDDPRTGKKVPTFYRTPFYDLQSDPAYAETLKYADEASLSVYLEEIKQLEKARDDIVRIASGEEPYDVFLCCKETDEDGDWTPDSRLAQNVYNALESYGYRVFFSRVSLAGKDRQAQEPYIYGALTSAKVMLVFETGNGSCNDPRVRGEWRRYLQRMTSENTGLLISCVRNVSLEALPKAFSKCPSLDMGNEDAIPELLGMLRRRLPKTAVMLDTEKKERIAGLSEACQKALADKDFSLAEKLGKEILEEDPENTDGCYYLLLAQYGVKEPSQLLYLDCSFPFYLHELYSTLLTHASEDPRVQQLHRLEPILRRQKEEEKQRAREKAQRIALENQRRQRYEEGVDQLLAGAYAQALSIFEEVSAYRDVSREIARCNEGIRFQKLERAYRAEVGDGKRYLTKRYRWDHDKEYQAYLRLHKKERRWHRRYAACQYLGSWSIGSFLLLGAAGLSANSSFLPLVFLVLLVVFVVKLTFRVLSCGFFRKLITAIFMLGMDFLFLFLLAELDGAALVGLYAALLSPIPLGIGCYLQNNKLVRRMKTLEQGPLRAYGDRIRQELTEKYGADVTKLVSLEEISWENDPRR